MKSLKKKADNFFAKLVFTVVLTAVGFIPLWVYLLAKLVFHPQGFWQKLFLFGVGVYFLGFIQLILFVFWAVLTLKLWMEF